VNWLAAEGRAARKLVLVRGVGRGRGSRSVSGVWAGALGV